MLGTQVMKIKENDEAAAAAVVVPVLVYWPFEGGNHCSLLPLLQIIVGGRLNQIIIPSAFKFSSKGIITFACELQLPSGGSNGKLRLSRVIP